MQHVQIMLGSTRRGRAGEQVARWVYDLAARQPAVFAEYIDLRDWQLPFYDEAGPRDSPSSELVPRWREKIASADAYVFVSPEYNHGYTAVLKNALDYGGMSWRYKPAGFVSYSIGMSGGARAIEQLRQVLVELGMVSTKQTLLFPRVDQFSTQLEHPGALQTAEFFFEELLWWSRALKPARMNGVPLPPYLRQRPAAIDKAA